VGIWVGQPTPTFKEKKTTCWNERNQYGGGRGVADGLKKECLTKGSDDLCIQRAHLDQLRKEISFKEGKDSGLTARKKG